jgi:hypothetical protein
LIHAFELGCITLFCCTSLLPCPPLLKFLASIETCPSLLAFDQHTSLSQSNSSQIWIKLNLFINILKRERERDRTLLIDWLIDWFFFFFLAHLCSISCFC